MASKGRSESNRSRSVPTSKVKKRQSGATDGGSSGVEQSADVTPESWTFEIVQPTPVAAGCRAGDAAQGINQATRSQ
jgi:hypothetical protein